MQLSFRRELKFKDSIEKTEAEVKLIEMRLQLEKIKAEEKNFKTLQKAKDKAVEIEAAAIIKKAQVEADGLIARAQMEEETKTAEKNIEEEKKRKKLAYDNAPPLKAVKIDFSCFKTQDEAQTYFQNQIIIMKAEGYVVCENFDAKKNCLITSSNGYYGLKGTVLFRKI